MYQRYAEDIRKKIRLCEKHCLCKSQKFQILRNNKLYSWKWHETVSTLIIKRFLSLIKESFWLKLIRFIEVFLIDIRASKINKNDPIFFYFKGDNFKSDTLRMFTIKTLDLQSGVQGELCGSILYYWQKYKQINIFIDLTSGTWRVTKCKFQVVIPWIWWYTIRLFQ